MKRILSWVAALALMLSPIFPIAVSCAQDDEKVETTESKSDKQDPEGKKGEEQFEEYNEEFANLRNEFSEKAGAIRSKLRDATDEEREAIMESMQTAQTAMLAQFDAIGEKMLELAKPENSDPEIAFEAISWTLGQAQNADLRNKAVELLLANHVDNEQFGSAFDSIIGGMPSQATEDMLSRLAENGASDKIKGIATISLATYLSTYKEMVAGMVDDEAFAKQFPDSIDYFRKLAKVEDEQVEALLKKSVGEYADVEYQESTIGEIATAQIKKIEVLKNLQVGKVAPDIEGPDIDGVTFKLSDYRGKVVMLDFWGDW